LKARAQVGAVYAAGLLQGLALVTFPAASAVFTDPQAYDLSNAQYGGLFAPQTVMAIAGSLLGGRLAARVGQKRVLLFGLAANLASMALLIASRFSLEDHAGAFALLLGSTSMMGIGFGLTVPALNTFAAALFPERIDAAVLAMNALLGLGTALAPLFVSLGIWWGLPLGTGVLLAAVMVWIGFLSLDATGAQAPTALKASSTFWLFAAFALLYGVVETLNGTWAVLYMKGVLGGAAGVAAAALTLFWAAATAGRILFAGIERWLPSRHTFRLLPVVIAAAFVATALVPSGAPALGIAAFALAGLGCSALLPLTISLGRGKALPGTLIACYQLGYGLAAFGAGPLHDRAGLGLRALFAGAAVVALGLAGLAAMIIRNGRTSSTAASPMSLGQQRTR
jgi:fucose permease